MAKELWKGNEAIAEAALRAGVEAYFGYPITPQTELLEYMAREIPKYPGRVFLQAESELAAVNMVYGAACAGVRVLSSSSSPGISLMTEGLSYIAGTEVPAVLVDIMRGGPGLGNIMPSQGDYFQMTKAMGHGDFHPIVLAPSTVQEAVDLTYGAFELAETYRTVVVILADGAIGQMMEPVVMPPAKPVMTEQDRANWALRGAKDRERRILTSLHLSAEGLERMNQGLQSKLARIQQKELRWQEIQTDDAEVLLVAFGTAGRICSSVVQSARAGRAEGRAVAAHQPVALPGAAPAGAGRPRAADPGGRDERRPDGARRESRSCRPRACPLLRAHGRRRAAAGRDQPADRQADFRASRQRRLQDRREQRLRKGHQRRPGPRCAREDLNNDTYRTC